MFSTTIRRSAMTAAAVGALGLGGTAIAAAADTSSTTAPSSSKPGASQAGQRRPQREALSSAIAAKVKAAALDKVPGATVLRTESGGPYNSAYHAHVKTTDGTLKVVLVNASFEATAVQADQGRGGARGPGGHGGHGGLGGHGGHGGHGGGGGGETALTGDTKEKVEAAVLAKYAGATIVRTETNGDSSAPYESHIKTSAGKELEVLVSKDFKVLDARERPARP